MGGHYHILKKINELFNPGIPIPKEASDIHKKTDDMVRNKPFFESYSKEFV